MEENTWYAVDETMVQGDQESLDNDDQSLINTYVTMMLQAVQIDPWMNIPQILKELVEVGPLWSEYQILQLFGGWEIFRRTVQRMEVIRGNTVRDDLNSLPITTRPESGEPFGHTIPEDEGFIAWWAPQVGGSGPPFMFSIRSAGGGTLQRYPHTEEYTDEYEEEEESETDGEMDVVS